MGFYIKDNTITLLLIALVLLALWWSMLFTGILSHKKHSKINLILTIIILIYGIVLMIININDKDSYYASFEAALIYGSVALAAWITDNKVLKIIRTILVILATLFLGYLMVILILAALFMPDLSGLRGLC
ncbi:MAG: hypothetical protein IJU82_02150 [Ruminiclostridium sp.]|nr:hypothetical protein [Ruminiclostridium sp.]